MVSLQEEVVEVEAGLDRVSHEFQYNMKAEVIPPAPPGIGGGGGGGGGAGISPKVCVVVVWRLLSCPYARSEVCAGERTRW